MTDLRRGGRHLVAAGAAAALAIALAGVTAGPALGHAELVTSSPGAGEVVPEPPSELILVFSEPLEPGFSAVDVVDAAGTAVVTDAGSVSPADDHQLTVRLPPLEPGVHTVTWRSLSAADGHDASGFFSFGVGDIGAAVPGAGGSHVAGDHDWLTAGGRWLGYLGLMAGLGLPMIALVVLRRPLRTAALRVVAGLLVLSGLAVLAMVIWSALTTSPGEAAAYLLGSRNGSLQLARGMLMTAGGVAVWLVAARSPGRASALAAVTGLGAIGLLAVSGHAAGLAGVAPVISQAIHVAAVAIWLGGVATLLGCLAIPAAFADDLQPMRVLVPRFSALAVAAMGLVGITGFYASWSQTGSLLAIDTPYGTVLVIKLGLALVALTLGALNYFDAGRRKRLLADFRPRLAAELTIAVAVLLASSVLSITPPLEGARSVVIEPVPDAFGRVLPGMQLELSPARPGVNRVTVTAAGALGTVPIELVLDRLDEGGQTRISLRHVGGHEMPDMPGMDHGSVTGAPEDHWVADAVVLPARSSWNATVRVLSAPGGAELSRQRYAFAIGDGEVTQGVLPGPVDVELGFAGLLLVGGAGSIGLGLGGMRLPRCDPTASRFALVAGGAVAAVLGLAVGFERMLV